MKIFDFLSNRPNLRLSFHSFSYFFSEKVIRIVVGFILQTWLARHLGPENMGVYSYVADFTAIFIPIVLFGLDDFIVRDIVKAEDPGKILGSIFYFRLILGVFAWVALIVSIYFVRREAFEVFLFTAAYGSLVIFRSFDTFSAYFHANYLIKPLTQGRQLVYVAASSARAMGLIAGLGIIFFLANTWVQMVFERVISYIQLKRLADIRLSYDSDYLRKLLPHALPIALTGFFTFGETRLGTFFLNKYNTLEAVGSFGVGRGLLDLWEFIPVSICLTVFPIIVSAHAKNSELYENKLAKLYCGLFYLGIGFALSITVLSRHIIHLLYGPAFSGTVPVLVTGAWMSVITYLNLARVKWYILEHHTRIWLGLCVLTFFLNVSFQFYYTPEYGLVGPYMASISAHLIGNMLFGLFNKHVRNDLRNVVLGVFLPIRYILSR